MAFLTVGGVDATPAPVGAPCVVQTTTVTRRGEDLPSREMGKEHPLTCRPLPGAIAPEVCV
jgi:hypothetical protein